MGSFRPYIPLLLAIRHCLLHLPQVIVSNLLKSPRLPFIFGFLVFSLILVTLIHFINKSISSVPSIVRLYRSGFPLCTALSPALIHFLSQNARSLLSAYINF